ncbi:MAG: glycosyltransferase [Proteobacteria bacterium]|nr:glycosyltransferase [Pseudomonadota bacterium]
METGQSLQQQNGIKAESGGGMVKKQNDAEHPLVSIITIVLNGESWIRQTIDSVLQQDYGFIEYIVIDGGSHDDTVSILREYDSNIDFWQSEPDKGISDAFNKGIKVAHGDVIGLINAGDWYEADTVRRVVEALLAEPTVGVVCGALQFWHGLQREYLCYSVPQLLGREMTVTHPTCFVRAELYRSFGLFSSDYKFAMDYELLLRFKKQGVRFLALDSVLANMQHDGISEENWKKALQETHRARIELSGKSFFTSRAYYWFILLKRQLRIFLEKRGWKSLLHFYRSRLAPVKKTKS